ETSIERRRRLKRESAARQRANQSSEQNERRKRQYRESKGQKITCDAPAELTQTLTRLEAILIRNGFRLTDFPNMPLPLQLFNNHIQQNYLLAKELQYDRDFLK
ncbi:35803_t:CDS:2, partial [Racocetra persica]